MTIGKRKQAVTTKSGTLPSLKKKAVAKKKPTLSKKAASARGEKFAARAEHAQAAATSTGAPELAMLREMQTSLRRIESAMLPAAAGHAVGHEEDDSVNALRRVLSDLLERRGEAVMARLVAIRGRMTAAGGNLDDLRTAVDDLLTDLGAVRFEASLMEYMDPLIHTVGEEASREDIPAGVVLACLAPGFHSPQGAVLAKALVAVNRRA